MRTKSSGISPVLALAAMFSLAALLFIALLSGREGGRWTLAAGGGGVYAAPGNTFACASSTGLRVYGEDGGQLLSIERRLESPALSAAGDYLAAWDAGGEELLFAGGTQGLLEVETGGELVSARVNEGGFLAVAALGGGGLGTVTVYSPDGEAVYRWHAGTAWPLEGCVSPSGEYLAVLAASEDGGQVRLFRLDGTEELWRADTPGELPFALGWLGEERLCAVSAGRALFLTPEGGLEAEQGFGPLSARRCSFGEGFAVAELADGEGRCTLVSLSAEGERLGRLELDRTPLDLSLRGECALLLLDGEARLLDSSLSELGARAAEGAVAALLAGNGEAILVRRGWAEAVYI